MDRRSFFRTVLGMGAASAAAPPALEAPKSLTPEELEIREIAAAGIKTKMNQLWEIIHNQARIFEPDCPVGDLKMRLYREDILRVQGLEYLERLSPNLVDTTYKDIAKLYTDLAKLHETYCRYIEGTEIPALKPLQPLGELISPERLEAVRKLRLARTALAEEVNAVFTALNDFRVQTPLGTLMIDKYTLHRVTEDPRVSRKLLDLVPNFPEDIDSSIGVSGEDLLQIAANFRAQAAEIIKPVLGETVVNFLNHHPARPLAEPSQTAIAAPATTAAPLTAEDIPALVSTSLHEALATIARAEALAQLAISAANAVPKMEGIEGNATLRINEERANPTESLQR